MTSMRISIVREDIPLCNCCTTTQRSKGLGPIYGAHIICSENNDKILNSVIARVIYSILIHIHME